MRKEYPSNEIFNKFIINPIERLLFQAFKLVFYRQWISFKRSYETTEMPIKKGGDANEFQ